MKPWNESVLREVHPLPTVDEALSQLAGAKVFTKVDTNCGFWQVPLAKASWHSTIFITPNGRYCFNKLPFGISSAPEHFQRRMNKILTGLDGVLCHLDDVLVYGSTQQEHNQRITAVLERIQSKGETLNPNKCEFSRSLLTFLRHIINQDGIKPDSLKTAAIWEMTTPSTITELLHFMGMVNQVGKFSPKLSQPLRELFSNKRAWIWGPAQEKAFDSIKLELSKPTNLAHFDLEKETKVSADASAYGLGAVLLQQHSNEGWKPVAYSSRSMSETERRNAQIEKEALVAWWACKNFSHYILGKKFHLETNN